MRFDEVELQAVPIPELLEAPAPQRFELEARPSADAPLFRRFLAIITDLSLFVALALAMSPLLPASWDWRATAALTGFVLMTSYYYFVGTWLLWGKTIGGAIFEVKVVPDEDDDAMSVAAASLRWLGVCASVVVAGLGFAMAMFPGRRSLADRVSATRCVNGR